MSIDQINEMKQRAYAVHNGPWLCDSDIAALFAEAEKVEALHSALQDLVMKLEAVHEHPKFRSVWMVAHHKIGPYDGPHYTEELARANEVLGRTPDENAKNAR